jgi:hypothetical protein
MSKDTYRNGHQPEGTSTDPSGKNKVANAKKHAIHNPLRLRHKAKPGFGKDDAELGLSKIVRYSPEYVRTLVAITLRRPEIMQLWAAGSFHFTYWFFWTCEVTAGWRATPEQLAAAESKESTNSLCHSANPLLMVPVPAWAGNCRGLLRTDIHYAGSPARIIRVAIGLRVNEMAEVEREGCHLTRRRTLGFAGNRRDGGTSTEPKEGNIHGVSVLVIPDLSKLGLVVGPQFASAYAARALQGSEPAATPPPPSTSFEPPPREASGAFVLGGQHFLAARGLGSGGGGSAGGAAAGSGLPPPPVLPGFPGAGDDGDDDDDGGPGRRGGGSGGGLPVDGGGGGMQRRPICKFGTSCYRKNPEHLAMFDHPPEPAAPSSKAVYKARVQLPAGGDQPQAKKVKANRFVVLDEDSDELFD